MVSDELNSACFLITFAFSFFASEMIRASLFQHLKKELPYCCEVQVTEFKEPSTDSTKQVIRMKATVFVERDSQKVIVIGKGGEVIKKVGMEARKQLEDFFQSQVGYYSRNHWVGFRAIRISLDSSLLSLPITIRFTWNSMSRWTRIGGRTKAG